MKVWRTDLPLMLLTASGGLLSAFIAMCLRFTVAHHAGSQNNRFLLNFGQNLVPGAVFGAVIFCCFALRGYSRSLWKFMAMTVASSSAYFVAVWVAFGVELYSPFLPPQERGNVSWQALFVSGLVGAFFVIFTASLLLTTKITGQQRMFKILSWTPVGGFLGIVGWALGPSLGIVLWQIIHSMDLAAPGETLRNAFGDTSHIFSLWAVWQIGMGCILGSVVGRKHRMANEPSATQQ